MRSLEFSNASTPVNAVTNSLSFTSVFLSTAFIARLPASIIDSCTPPKCGACGGLKCHMTPLLAVYLVTLL